MDMDVSIDDDFTGYDFRINGTYSTHRGYEFGKGKGRFFWRTGKLKEFYTSSDFDGWDVDTIEAKRKFRGFENEEMNASMW